MLKNNKIINIESVEMIDSHYFYIHKEPRFFCLEIFSTDTSKDSKGILEKIQGNKLSFENDIMIKSFISKRGDENRLKIIYSGYSLKKLKEYTNNLSLALEDEIIEFINTLNKEAEG